MNSNYTLPFYLKKTNTRGRLTKLDTQLNELITNHDYPEVVNEYLSKLIAICESVAGLLEYEGSFTMQMQSEGPLNSMMVDIDAKGNFRAYAKYDLKIKEDKFENLTKNGYLAFTADKNKKKYQGIVEIKQKSFEKTIEHYFSQSEQIETAIKASSKKTKDGWKASCLIIQQLPEEQESGFDEANIFFQTLTKSELLSEKISSEELLYKLFNELTVAVFDKKELKFKCRCSKAKILSFLKTLSETELDNLIKNGKISTKCEFCQTSYNFSKKDILK